MARRKETIWQSDFSLGAVRPEAVERDDTALIETSVREAVNTICLSTGQIEERPGLVYVSDTTAGRGVEINLGNELIYDLQITPTGVVLYDSTGAVEYSNTSTDWTAITGKYGTYAFADIKFWIVGVSDSSAVLIGSQKFPVQVLQVDSAGSWTLGPLDFATTLAGAISQPYWRYYEGVTIQPSGRSGTITVTASSGIWTSAHSGLAIRYVDKEIILGSTVSATVINATVTEELPPTYTIAVASASGYQVGDAVEHSVLGGQGIITAISGTNITVLVTSKYDGFDATATPKLVAPNAGQVISSVTAASPASTFLWDTQMLNNIHGYPGTGARHKGRLYLADFPSAPQAFAASASGEVFNFKAGVNDGDAFTETVGSDRGGALKYIVSAEDLLFLTTKGLYYQVTRDGSAVTPSNIGPISFSRMGCAAIEPAVVDDGCIFIDAVGRQVYSAMLAGDVYRSWRAQPLAKYHDHLITDPVQIGATSSGSEKPEQFIFITNSDGSVAVCQWDRDANTVSWRPWETDGSFLALYECFKRTHAVIDRTIAGVGVRTRERFEYGIVMDCVSAVSVDSDHLTGQDGVTFTQGVTAFATQLTGHVATVYFEGWDLGDLTIDGSGKPLDQDGNVLEYPTYAGIAQVGIPFDMTILPWARRSVRVQDGTRDVKKLISLYVTVQATGTYLIDGQTFGGYRVGDSLEVPPAFVSQQKKITFFGGDQYESKPITKGRPGPFRLLKLGYRVVI